MTTSLLSRLNGAMSVLYNAHERCSRERAWNLFSSSIGRHAISRQMTRDFTAKKLVSICRIDVRFLQTTLMTEQKADLPRALSNSTLVVLASWRFECRYQEIVVDRINGTQYSTQGQDHYIIAVVRLTRATSIVIYFQSGVWQILKSIMYTLGPDPELFF